MSGITNTVWTVTHGYAGMKQAFISEEEAVEFWRKQASAPSYVRPEKKQPASVFKVVTHIEELQPDEVG